MHAPVSPVPPFTVVGIIGNDPVAEVFAVRTPAGRLSQLTVGRAPVHDSTGRSLFASWARTLTRLGTHPHVVPLIASGFTVDHRPYVVLASDAGILTDRLLATGALPPQAAREVAIALGSSLVAFAEFGLAHGTVCPSTTIMTHAVQLGGHALSAPFLLRAQEPTVYTAPEHLRAAAAGEFVTSNAADVYSLAATVYVSLGGRLPWSFADPRAVTDVSLRSRPVEDVPGVSPAFVALLRAGLTVDHRARPTAVQLCAEFRRLQPEPMSYAPPKPVDRNALRGINLREAAVSAVLGAVASKGVDGAVGVASRVMEWMVPDAVHGIPAASSTTPATASVPSTGSGAVAQSGGASVASTAPAAGTAVGVKITVAAVAVAGIGVGGHQIVQHTTCGNIVGDRPAAAVLADASLKTDSTTYGYEAEARMGPVEGVVAGVVDPSRRRFQATVTTQGQNVDVVVIDQIWYVRPSGAAEWQRQDLASSSLKGLFADAADPSAFSGSLESVESAERVEGCTFKGTLLSSDLGLPGQNNAAVPFEATVDTKGRLTHLLMGNAASGGDDNLTIDLKLFDFGERVEINAPT